MTFESTSIRPNESVRRRAVVDGITSVAALAYWVGLWTLHTSYHMFNGTVNFLFTFIFLMILDAVLLGLTRRRRA